MQESGMPFYQLTWLIPEQSWHLSPLPVATLKVIKIIKNHTSTNHWAQLKDSTVFVCLFLLGGGQAVRLDKQFFVKVLCTGNHQLRMKLSLSSGKYKYS